MLSTFVLLWLPILVAVFLVYIAEMIVNMVLPFHRQDFRAVSDEDGLRETVRAQKLAQGQYFFPYAESPEAMKSPDWREKMEQGPVGLLFIAKNSSSMTPFIDPSIYSGSSHNCYRRLFGLRSPCAGCRVPGSLPDRGHRSAIGLCNVSLCVWHLV